MSTITIGIDLVKQVFSACEMDANGRVHQRKDFRRDAFAAWLPQLSAGTRVTMEACSGAHHWARRCLDYGLQPRLIAAQFVTPFRKAGPPRTTATMPNAPAVDGKLLTELLGSVFISQAFHPALRPTAIQKQ